jgi:DNA-binding winged helix-turn-helix (wHTH) protein
MQTMTAPLDAPRLGFGNFSLDPANRLLVTSDGTVVPMTRRVFDTLWVLAESRGALVTKSELSQRVWGEAVVEENTLSRTVSTLRRVLHDHMPDARFISTVSGYGYRFVSTVVTLPFRRTTGSHAKVDARAYQLYLRGKAQLSQAGLDRIGTALQFFREAVSIDSSYPEAWAAAAFCCSRILIFAEPRAQHALLRELETAAARLMHMDPDWWGSHLAASWSAYARCDWAATESALRRATDLASTLPWEVSMHWGAYYAQIGNPSAAADHLRQTVALDSTSLLSSSFYQMQLHAAGREEEAEMEYRRSQELVGDRDMAEHVAVLRAWSRGEEFRAQFRRYLDHQSVPLQVLHEVYLGYGRSKQIVGLLVDAARSAEYPDPFRQTVLSCWLARYEQWDVSLASLERAYVKCEYTNVSFLWLPIFAPLRQHSAFRNILRRWKLA